MNSAVVRDKFLDFFRSKGHYIVSSAPMVIKNDPTLMFTNAGMNQFKDLFLGNREPQYRRIADTQKCLRVSGKHNDLEEVGIDTYHHTMFEMLGNWSFGDYFKKEAIAWGWELLTEVYGISPDRLYVTVFEGDPSEGLGRDEESLGYWNEILHEDYILDGSKKDNFWEMGDTGPCGPCSEIHVDIRNDRDRKKIPGRELVNKGHPQVIEIWNLVFIEFNRQADGQLVKLPARHVDTGLGFERLCMVLQGKTSNYDTDIFQPIISAIALKSGISYGTDEKSDIAMRVIADHLRAVSFAIADGQIPSNVKAGYVIRRILRRAVRYGYVFLGFREPFIHHLVPVVADQMGKIFPELIAQQAFICNVIREEEVSFLRTLETGIQRFTAYIQSSPTSTVGKQPGVGVIDGAFAFELFDTYGFPVDLTRLMAREAGWSVDMEGFRSGLEEQKARSRRDSLITSSDWTIVAEDIPDSFFVGYDQLVYETGIVKFRKVRKKEEDLYHIVLGETPFYAESGGQVGDRGWLTSAGRRIEVIDTVHENDLIIHITKELPPHPEAPILAEVDTEKRRASAGNHSATHLLHAALRQVLGPHVEQKGSLVDENRLRFDFTHFARMTREEIEQIERLVNRKIRENISLHEERNIPMEKAKAMGAMALFGEKYGDRVRVIRFDPDFSTELCGGTHVPYTGQIGLFRIVSEGAIAAGIRRVEAITAKRAEDFMYGKEQLLSQVNERLKQPKDLLKGIDNLMDEYQELKKIAAEYEKIKLIRIKDDLKNRIRVINGISFLAEVVDQSPESMKNTGFEMKNEIKDLFLLLVSESSGKVNLLLALSDNLTSDRQLNASYIIRELAVEVEGSGGGQPSIASAGGKNPAGIPEVIRKAATLVNRMKQND
jgi:alanyl-tRNA synthetase